MFGNKIIRLGSINSTNTYLKELTNNELVAEGTIVCAENQTAGRGQRGNTWLSAKNENLLLSFVVYPKFLAADRQFLLSEMTALAVADLLKQYLKNVTIKWPNDLYVNDLKIAGILIEHSISGAAIDKTIVGIGLNVNQQKFDNSIPNPSSMYLETGKKYELELLLSKLCENLNFWYDKLLSNNNKLVDNKYINSLYRFGIKSWFEDKNGKFEATINGVNALGQLSMTDEKGSNRLYSFKEVVFCLN